jgi:hypothetical protein
VASRLARTQGWYYLATGVWPLLSRRTFEAVTGPKADFWLAQTVGVLVASLGAGLVEAGRRDHVPRELALVGALAAGGLGATDTIFVLRGRIRPIYLIDALVDFALAAAWVRSGTLLHLPQPRDKGSPDAAPQLAGA